MTPAAIVTLMLSLIPSAPRARVEPIATAISNVAADTDEAVLLTVISYYEDAFGRAGVPFGACSFLCAHRCGRCRQDRTLEEVARWSLGLLRRTRRVCGQDAPLSVRLGWYHTGRCRSDQFAHREAETVRTLTNRATAQSAR